MIAILRAIALLARDRRLRRLALLPFAVNVALVAGGIPLLLWLGYASLDWFLPTLVDWPVVLQTLARILAAGLIALFGVIALLILGRIIAAPLITKLTEAVEERVLRDSHVPRRTTVRDDVVDVWRGAVFAIGRLVLFLMLYPVILLVGLVPVAGPFLGPLLGFLYGSLVLSLDFSEPVFERHLPGFRNRVRHVLGRPVQYFSFGGTCFLMALVPLANLAVLPVCATGATILFLQDASKNRPV